MLFSYIGDCNNPLGMENGNIPDDNLAATVSSYEGNNSQMFGVHRARLKSSSGYRTHPSALSQDPSPFVVVELPREMIVTGIATQGLGREWVRKYTMFTADNSGALVSFRDVKVRN